MEVNKIYLGDAYELIKEVPDRSVDLVVTDPPYEFGTGGIGTGIFKGRKTVNDTYREIHKKGLGEGIDSEYILSELVRVMKKINIYIWCNKEQIFDYLQFFVKDRGCNFEIIIWSKLNPPPFLGGHYLKDKEYCLYFWEKGVKVHPTYETGRTVYTTQLNVADKKEFVHPTIKDLNIIENLIANSSNEGDLVLDVFLGSGTTCVGAKHLNRNYLGFEIDEHYFKIAQDRINGINAKGEMNLFDLDTESSSVPFEQLSLLEEEDK